MAVESIISRGDAFLRLERQLGREVTVRVVVLLPPGALTANAPEMPDALVAFAGVLSRAVEPADTATSNDVLRAYAAERYVVGSQLVQVGRLPGEIRLREFEHETKLDFLLGESVRLAFSWHVSDPRADEGGA